MPLRTMRSTAPACPCIICLRRSSCCQLRARRPPLTNFGSDRQVLPPWFGVLSAQQGRTRGANRGKSSVVSGTAKYVRQDHRVSLGLLMFAFTLAGMMVLGGGRARASHVDCGETITADMTLDSDLINCPAHGIVIGADDITLDLNGHTVDGDGGEDDFGDFGIDNMDGHDGVTIEGGSIRQFGEGVEMDGARDNIVRDLATSHQLHAGIFVLGSSDVRIEKNSVFSYAAGIVLARVSHVR